MDLKDIFFVFFPRLSREIIQSAGSWFEEELICQQGRTGILISTAMKSQYNSEAAVSFGTRSFIFYIFCHCFSLFSSLWQQQSVINVIMINCSTQTGFTHLPNCNFPSLYFRCSSKHISFSLLPVAK